MYQGTQSNFRSKLIDGACKCAPARSREKTLHGKHVDRSLAPALFKIRLWQLLCFLAAGFLLFAAQAHALDPNRLISQYGHTTWRAQDGVVVAGPAITQTTDGYIWMMSARQLLRFDGTQFIRWQPPSEKTFPSSFTAAVAARDGSLWLGTRAGLSRLKDGKVTTYSKPGDHSGISEIIEDHAGRIWVTRYGTKGGGALCEVSGDGLRCYGSSDGLPAKYGLGLTEDLEGNILFGGEALYRWKPGAKVTQYLDATKHPDINSVVVDHSGNLWVAMQDPGPHFGVQYFHNGSWSEYATAQFHSSTLSVGCLFVDKAGALWIGADDGLYRIWNGVVDHYSRNDGLSGHEVSGIFEDGEGNLWVSTDGGVDMFRNTPVFTYSMDEGLISNEASTVLASREGTVWAGGGDGFDWPGEKSSSVLPPGSNQRFTGGPRFPGKIGPIFEDHSGAVWIGVSCLTVYEHGRVKKVLTRDGKVLADSISAIVEDPAQTIVALSGTKLYRIRDRRVIEAISLPKRLGVGGFLAVNPDGGIWIAGQKEGLMLYKDAGIQSLSLLNSAEPIVINSMVADLSDPLLLATSVGLLRWDGKRWQLLNDAKGLPCNHLLGILKDRHGSVWLQATCGLLKMESAELQKWRQNPQIQPSFTVFDALDGAATGKAYNLQPLMSLAPDGKVWFANGSKIQVLNPDRVYNNPLLPPVHVEQLVADDKPYPSAGQVRIPPNPRNLEIDYTALSFSVPQRVLFRYFLEGHDKFWQGPVTRRQAFYTDLAPGKYRFHVIASNNSGVWNDAGAVAEFVVEPSFYQTLWFQCLVAIAAVCALWVFYTQRLRKATAEVSARLGERLQERERIARELHDTLLQDLQAVILRFQLVANRLTKEDPNRMAMENGLDYADKVLAEGRNQIRGIRADTQAMDELSKSLAAYGEELAQLWPRSFHLTVIGKQFELYPVVRDEIYRIGREALGNAFKHSNGSAVEVEIAYLAAEFRIQVSDDGDGIDSDLADRGRPGHWGIHNMRERARKIGAVLNILGRPNNGTSVELTIPLDLASERIGLWSAWRRKNSS